MITKRLQYWLLRIFSPSTSDEFDSALIVSLLNELGECSVSDIKWKMNDYTRGEWDWMMRTDRRTFRLLDRLESDGTIQSRLGMIGKRVYCLSAPRERMLRVL